MDTFRESLDKLEETIGKDEIDWSAFDSILAGVDDINAIYSMDRTLLSEILYNENFHKNGRLMPGVVRHFLDNGYDVTANEGRNGGSPLSSLCWTSYDKYILDTAKVLLNAGAPVEYESAFDDPCKKTSGVIENIGWKLSGAWCVDKDYDFANILEAYFSIAKAAKAGDDHNSILSFHECIGKTLTGVSLILKGTENINEDGDIRTFSGSLVMWFEDIPLVTDEYINVFVNPPAVEKGRNILRPADEYFKNIIGSSLIRIKYAAPHICFFYFDNGQRITFTYFKNNDRTRKAAFEISANETVDISKISFSEIRRHHSTSYADGTTSYEEETLALFNGKESFLLYTTETGDRLYGLECIKINSRLLKEYDLQFPVQAPDAIEVFKTSGTITGLRIKFGPEYLYLTSSAYIGIKIALSDIFINPHDYTTHSLNFGKEMEFKEIKTASEM